MIKWAITLGEFDISYQPKPAEKGQAVADLSPTSHILLTLFLCLKKWFHYPRKLRKLNQHPQHRVYMLMAHPTNRVVEQN
ncbi:hypothetical protein FF2_022465 [Malus domestica]